MGSISYQEGNILYNNSDSFSYITKDMNKKKRMAALKHRLRRKKLEQKRKAQALVKEK